MYEVIFHIARTTHLTVLFLFLHEALDMEKKKNEHAPKGIRKNVLKARLIIRNLSFQVQ